MSRFSSHFSRRALATLTLSMSAVLLVACGTAPQQPVALDQNSFAKPEARIGVVMLELPKVDTHFPGASCLLCMATASLANSSLTSHVQTLPSSDLASLKSQVVNLLKKKGNKVVSLDEPLNLEALPDAGGKEPNIARKDFKSLANRFQIDKLIVINIQQLGVRRDYSAYIPTSDPKAVVSGLGYAVNLSTNTYEWFMPFDVLKAAEGTWDEGPKFPGLTNAYYQSIEEAKDRVTAPLR